LAQDQLKLKVTSFLISYCIVTFQVMTYRLFAMHQAADSQTQMYPSQMNTDLPTLLTAQRALPADSKRSWKGLPAEITGSWKVRSSTESVNLTLPISARSLEEHEKKKQEIPECGIASRNPIIRCKPEELQRLICAEGVQPWDSKVLLQQRLEKIRLAYKEPLRACPSVSNDGARVKVVDGLRKFTNELRWFVRVSHLGSLRSLDERTFVKTLLRVLDQNYHDGFIDLVLESMDFKKSETLSVGEWAQGLAAIFEGTQEEKEHAIFDLLDVDGDHYLSYEELKEYLKPFVKAMIPAEASVLQPCLLQHCTDQVLRSIKSSTCRVVAPSNVEKYGSDMVSSEEFFQWLRQNDLGDFLARIIDAEVGRISLQHLIDDYRI